jgi:hypothetical protein
MDTRVGITTNEGRVFMKKATGLDPRQLLFELSHLSLVTYDQSDYDHGLGD